MKRAIFCLFAGFAAVAAWATIDWAGDTSKTSEGYDTWIIAGAPHAASAPVIDGVVSAGEWDAAARNPLETFAFVDPAGTTMTARFAAMWDHTNIYVLVEASDSVGMVTTGHKFELYISTAYTRKFGAWQNPGYGPEDRQIVCSIKPDDTYFSPGLYGKTTTMPSFQRANTVNGISYVSEVKIAWADLGGLPSASSSNPDYIGLEVHTQRNGPVSPNTNRTKLMWAGVADTAWAATEDWGTLRLLPAGSVEPPTQWAGYPIAGGWVDTTPLLGWLQVDMDPWVYSQVFNKYLYLPETFVTGAGTWTFVPR